MVTLITIVHVFVCIFLMLVGGPSLMIRLALIALSIVLAFASWLYVEQPVRRGQWIFGDTKTVFSAAAAALVLFGGFGLAYFTKFGGGLFGWHFADDGQVIEPGRCIHNLRFLA